MAGPAASTSTPARGPRAWWRGLPRKARITLVAVTLLVFLAISGLLARYFSAENAERADYLALVESEHRGEVDAVLARLDGCRTEPKCVAQVHAIASNSRVRQHGQVKLLQVESKTASSLFGATGKTRLAWTVLGGRPVVQCVNVRRSGNPLTGIDVKLLSISAPISNEGKCHPPTAEESFEEEATEVELGHDSH
jgi:hypothetical protein